MQQFENNLCVLPKIIMSYHNCEVKKCAISEGNSAMKTQCSPEIRCSPSPCVFDKLDIQNEHNCDDNLLPSRSPSPDVYNTPKRRSPSPFRRSISPINRGDGSRRASTTTPTGYELYQKSLLEVPMSLDYGDASSDDLSSEWDSDVPETTHVLSNKV